MWEHPRTGITHLMTILTCNPSISLSELFGSLPGNLVNFHLQSDDALQIWDNNNGLYKADWTLDYFYRRGDPVGQKLGHTLNGANRLMTSTTKHEAYVTERSTR